MDLKVDYDRRVVGDVDVGAVGAEDPASCAPSPANTVPAADTTLYKALVAARGATSPKVCRRQSLLRSGALSSTTASPRAAWR